MKGEVFNLAAYAIEKFSTEMDISKHIKAHFDEKRRGRAGTKPRDGGSSRTPSDEASRPWLLGARRGASESIPSDSERM